jgi:hypothetical protein
VTSDRETPLTVLVERHLIDLQLRDAPEQYLISRVLARLMESENLLLYATRLLANDRARALEHPDGV